MEIGRLSLKIVSLLGMGIDSFGIAWFIPFQVEFFILGEKVTLQEKSMETYWIRVWKKWLRTGELPWIRVRFRVISMRVLGLENYGIVNLYEIVLRNYEKRADLRIRHRNHHSFIVRPACRIYLL